MKRYILIGILMLLMLATVAVDAANETANVTVGGWKFTTDLSGWCANDNTKITPHNAEIMVPTEGYGYWAGVDRVDANAAEDSYAEVLYFPAFPNSPKGIKEYYAYSAKVSYIAVLFPPRDVVATNLEHNIAVYGSADKIPEEKKKADLENILKLSLSGVVTEGKKSGKVSDKLINLKGFTADQVEESSEKGDYSAASVLLDNETIAVISVWRGSVEPDSVPFKGTTYDILKSITITNAPEPAL